MVEFDTPEELIAACQKPMHGLPPMDAYAPMPVEGLAEAIGFKKQQSGALRIDRRNLRRDRRPRSARMDYGYCLPAQRGRPAAEQLAGLTFRSLSSA